MYGSSGRVYVSIVAIYLLCNFYLLMVSDSKTLSSLHSRINTSFLHPVAVMSVACRL